MIMTEHRAGGGGCHVASIQRGKHENGRGESGGKVACSCDIVQNRPNCMHAVRFVVQVRDPGSSRFVTLVRPGS